MKRYMDDLKELLSHRGLILAVLVMVLVGYGFSLAHTTIGVDDLEQDRYFGAEKVMLANGRFGAAVLDALASNKMTLQQSDLFALFFRVWAALSFCVLFRRIANEHISIAACGVFACMFICYPLVNELWEFTSAALTVSGGFLLVSFALLLVHSYLHSASPKHTHLLFASLLSMWFVACYESLVTVYIFLVFALLGMQMVWGTENEKKLGTVIQQGLVYAAVLIAGLLLRVVIHKAIIAVSGLHTTNLGDREIYWFSHGFSTAFEQFKYDFFKRILLHGIIYFPLTEFHVAVVLFIGLGIPLCRKYGWGLLLPGAGMLASLLLLQTVQGLLRNFRTYQVFEPFVAFVAMMLLIVVEHHSFKWAKWLPGTVKVLLCCLCVYQAIYLNYFLTLNHLRSEEEAQVVRTIGTQLQADYDMEKPVIFVGDYQLSDSITERASIQKYSLRWKIYAKAYGLYWRYVVGLLRYDPEILDLKLTHTNIWSVINWATDSYDQVALQKLFAYYGFDYQQADFDTYYEKGGEYVRDHQMPAYPKNGYIKDCGDFITVCIGPVE